MTKKSTPIFPEFPHFLHGGDYNPDQWIDTPEIWDEDMRLMKLANCNAMTMGIFSWTTLEPEEGNYDFSFLDTMMDKVAANGGKVILATPSGARPAWLSQKYPEVLRVDEHMQRHLHGERHNHCLTSPVYREKVRAINTRLAQRYKDHPALLMWHISNEYGGDCRCPKCAEAFRDFLRQRYGSLEKLNHEYWARFWSHTYTDWSQIEPPTPMGENCLHGLKLDWRRFVTSQTADFMKNEIAPLKEITPHIPVTTNMMELFEGLDYNQLKGVTDVVSWDNYPEWHNPAREESLPAYTAMNHDYFRCLLDGKPFMLMESTPSSVNWKPINKLKRPGMHILSSMQAVAHGSDTVQYFQWRKSRGSSEKFHGAVVDHVGHENTRVFREVADLGAMLQKMDDIVGAHTQSEVALIFDQENRWALKDVQGFNKTHMDYEKTALNFYESFWKRGVNVDVIDSTKSFEGYKLIVAPMLYLLKPGVAERLKTFVAEGGTLVTTYMAGMVNENDLCFLGGMPGDGLTELFGLWQEDIDALYDGETVGIKTCRCGEVFTATEMCALIHPTTATVRAEYTSEFYANTPALTENAYGKGRACFIAFRSEEFNDFYMAKLIAQSGVRRNLSADLPPLCAATTRTDGENEFLFLQNYGSTAQTLTLDEKAYTDFYTGEAVSGTLPLDGFGFRLLRSKL